jgi:hypothetical protein
LHFLVEIDTGAILAGGTRPVAGTDTDAVAALTAAAVLDTGLGFGTFFGRVVAGAAGGCMMKAPVVSALMVDFSAAWEAMSTAVTTPATARDTAAAASGVEADVLVGGLLCQLMSTVRTKDTIAEAYLRGARRSCPRGA